jgi:hypothetical protein
MRASLQHSICRGRGNRVSCGQKGKRAHLHQTWPAGKGQAHTPGSPRKFFFAAKALGGSLESPQAALGREAPASTTAPRRAPSSRCEEHAAWRLLYMGGRGQRPSREVGGARPLAPPCRSLDKRLGQVVYLCKTGSGTRGWMDGPSDLLAPESKAQADLDKYPELGAWGQDSGRVCREQDSPTGCGQ